ncbi:MAG TPA: glutathione S-transferase C-terminal domain-containing protein [Polyangia bacterium]|nr:glutathione S-transferase C-terminal domain-containing protein [Polyangia bacterium]
MQILRFVDLEEARAARGVRMLAAALLPSPWTEAAKGIFHVKQIPLLCVRFRRGDAAQAAWAGVRNTPAVLFDDEPPRAGWAEILSLAERLGGAASLVPSALPERARLFGLAHELAGENGLGWSARLIMIHGSLDSGGARSFPLPVAQFLAAQYGYAPERFASARARAVAILAFFERLLADSHSAGHGYLLGDCLTALDLYLAAFLTPIVGVTPEECPAVVPPVRSAFQYLGEVIGAELPPALVDHRRKIYREHLPWPIAL